MPNSASAKKRLRQNEAHRARNRSVKSAVRTQIRKLREAISAGDAEKSAAEFQSAAQKIDKGVAKRVFHLNTAARMKSRLSKAVKAVKA